MASGSDKRRRTDTITIRVTPDERAVIDDLSMRKGLSVGAFMRAAALGDPGKRARRRVPLDAKLLRNLLGEVGRTGNNLNQIARRVNTTGEHDAAQLRAALVAHEEMRQAILSALGVPHR